MGKMRVHLLAKELGIETKDLIAQLDRLGIRGRKAQSSLEDDEVTQVRAAFAAQEKPHVHVGEEKVVADRVVTADDQSLGEIHARETIVERRVRANVIRRRTSRVEVVPEVAEKPATQAESITAAAPAPRVAIEDLAATMPFFEDDSSLGAIVPEADIPRHDETDTPEDLEEPSAPDETGNEATVARRAPAIEREPTSPTPAPPSRAQTAAPAGAVNEAPRGARVLGRIDLKRTVTIIPSAPAAPRRPAPGSPTVPPVAADATRPARDGDAAKPAATEAEKPKAGRHKKRVVKKQDVLEFREKELRSGRIPKKKRALPGKEQRKTEITVPRASKRVIRISEVITVGDLDR